MKKLLLLVMIVFVVGCSTVGDVHQVNDNLAKVDALIIATEMQIGSDVRNGFMTPAERDALGPEVLKYKDYAKQARTLLSNGDPNAAQQRMNLFNMALIDLNKRILARQRVK